MYERRIDEGWDFLGMELAFNQHFMGCVQIYITEAVTSHAKRSTKTDVSIILGGLTRYLQPVDASWNKPFKQAYKALYSEWMATGEKLYTAADNMHGPHKALILRWVKESWNSIMTNVGIKSFRLHGIFLKRDGSDDGKIHCIKEGQIAAEALPIDTKKMVSLFEDLPEDDCDPFDESKFEEDEDQLVDNELAVEDS